MSVEGEKTDIVSVLARKRVGLALSAHLPCPGNLPTTSKKPSNRKDASNPAMTGAPIPPVLTDGNDNVKKSKKRRREDEHKIAAGNSGDGESNPQRRSEERRKG